MTEQKKEPGHKSVSLDSDMILSLNFVPQWARKPPTEIDYGRFKDGGHDERGGRRGGRSGGRRQERGGGSGDRRTPRRDGERRRPSAAPSGGHDYPRQHREHRERGAEDRRGPRRYEQVAPAPLHVRFLPEQKALSGLMRQVSATKRAYPLVDLASFLMSNPGYCFVKLEIVPDEHEAVLYQCKICHTVSFDRSEIESHIIGEHLDDFFDREEVECDAPSGKFVCVAKCGLSGELLGPPNHHSYQENLRRVYSARFSGMDFESYKDRVKVSHDPEDVERWKLEASKTIRYKLKQEPKPKSSDAEEAENAEAAEDTSMSLLEAERYMRDNVAEKSVVRTRKAALPEDVARNIKDRSIKRVLREEWQRESRFPIKLSFALRAAFKHRGMYVFKTGEGKGINFVTAVRPAPLDADHAIPAIHDMVTYLRENPGCTKQQIVEALRPGAAMDSEEVKELLQPLHWLVDRGHIIEFFNGTFSVPLAK